MCRLHAAWNSRLLSESESVWHIDCCADVSRHLNAFRLCACATLSSGIRKLVSVRFVLNRSCKPALSNLNICWYLFSNILTILVSRVGMACFCLPNGTSGSTDYVAPKRKAWNLYRSASTINYFLKHVTMHTSLHLFFKKTFTQHNLGNAFVKWSLRIK